MARLQRSPSRKVLAAVVMSAALALLPVTAGEALADSGPASGYGTGGSSYSGTYSAQDGGGSYRGGSATAAPAPQPAPTRAYTSGGGSYQGGSATAAPRSPARARRSVVSGAGSGRPKAGGDLGRRLSGTRAWSGRRGARGACRRGRSLVR